MEESFDEDEGDESLSLDASSGGGPPLIPGTSPSSISPGGTNSRQALPRGRQRLSPMETSLQSIDDPISPANYATELKGFDLAESIERPS